MNDELFGIVVVVCLVIGLAELGVVALMVKAILALLGAS